MPFGRDRDARHCDKQPAEGKEGGGVPGGGRAAGAKRKGQVCPNGKCKAFVSEPLRNHWTLQAAASRALAWVW